MQVIWIVRQLHQRGYAVAPYWLTLFMTLFSAMTLVMFALSNEGGATVDEAWEAVNSAMWLFTELSSTSFIAERCAAVLKAVTSQSATRPLSLHLSLATRAATLRVATLGRSCQAGQTSCPILLQLASAIPQISWTPLDVKDLTAGKPAFPTNNVNTAIGNDNFCRDESMKTSDEATPTMQNDVSAF
ncbi:hypothetical protein H2202_000673 [Exophiala xenobiotica]|nr:hypothetical protein H2202_000673 [Exophiala xenobiotica]